MEAQRKLVDRIQNMEDKPRVIMQTSEYFHRQTGHPMKLSDLEKLNLDDSGVSRNKRELRS